jgi:hypothetical protein
MGDWQPAYCPVTELIGNEHIQKLVFQETMQKYY